MNQPEHQALLEKIEQLFRQDPPLGDEERAQLIKEINASPEARKIYLEQCQLETALRDSAHYGALEPRPDVPKTSYQPKKQSRMSAAISLAAAAVMVIGISLWVYTNHSPQNPEQQPVADLPSVEKNVEPERIAIRPPVPMAEGPEAGEQLAASSNPAVDKGIKTKENSVVNPVPDPATEIATAPLPQTESLPGPAIGKLKNPESGTRWLPLADFNAGFHNVELGETLEARLNSGVRLKVVGPSSFTIKPSGMELSLETGKMTAEVFPSARGFKVLANGNSIVDHGTRFAVAANKTGISAVHVYDGEVSVNPPGQPAVDLSTGESLQVNGTQVKRIDFDTKLFPPKPLWTGSIEWYSKSISILTDAPRNLTGSELPDDHLVILEEQKYISTKRTIVVNQFKDGQLTSGSKKMKLPKGVKVSSYLIQYKKTNRPSETIAKVRFDGPVIGIITRAELLDDTDNQFGLTRTNYPASDFRRGFENNDLIKLLEDGRTIQFSRRNIGFDQFRILVAAD